MMAFYVFITMEREKRKNDSDGRTYKSVCGAKTEPQRKDFKEHYPEYSGIGGHMLRDHGVFHAVFGQQHPFGQSAAHGSAVGQNRGGEHPYDGRPDDDDCR